MAKWLRANRILSSQEHEAFWRLLSPLVTKLGGRISMDELAAFNTVPGSDIWFCADEQRSHIRSVMVTQVRQYKAGLRVLLLSHAAGDLDDFGPGSLEQAESVARHYGCQRLQVDGRRGWGKVLGEGWSEFSRSIEKEIRYG